MALVLKDRVKETTTSTGTGTINLAGAASGFQTFVAGVGSTNTTYYAIEDANGTAWEVGLGTVLSKVFSKFGITEEKMEEWSGMGGCGCSKRKKFLDKILPFKKRL